LCVAGGAFGLTPLFAVDQKDNLYGNFKSVQPAEVIVWSTRQ